MDAQDVKVVVEFERGLKARDPVVVRWTNCGQKVAGPGVVEKVNHKSVRVRLSRAVPGHSGGWVRGQVITVPLFWDMRRWSKNNRVCPAPVRRDQDCCDVCGCFRCMACGCFPPSGELV